VAAQARAGVVAVVLLALEGASEARAEVQQHDLRAQQTLEISWLAMASRSHVTRVARRDTTSEIAQRLRIDRHLR